MPGFPPLGRISRCAVTLEDGGAWHVHTAPPSCRACPGFFCLCIFRSLLSVAPPSSRGCVWLSQGFLWSLLPHQHCQGSQQRPAGAPCPALKSSLTAALALDKGAPRCSILPYSAVLQLCVRRTASPLFPSCPVALEEGRAQGTRTAIRETPPRVRSYICRLVFF